MLFVLLLTNRQAPHYKVQGDEDLEQAYQQIVGEYVSGPK
jgi:hypothetical protein